MNGFDIIVKARMVTANDSCTVDTVQIAVREAMLEAIDGAGKAYPGAIAIEINAVYVMTADTKKGKPHGD